MIRVIISRGKSHLTMCNRAQWLGLEADQARLYVLTSNVSTRAPLSPTTYGRKVYTTRARAPAVVHVRCAHLVLPRPKCTPQLPGVCGRCGSGMQRRHAHTHTQAYLKPSNEICNVVISFLSFKGGIERREGLGLYYHTPWREGQGHGSIKGLLKET